MSILMERYTSVHVHLLGRRLVLDEIIGKE
jgi:hypothetical protein